LRCLGFLPKIAAAVSYGTITTTLDPTAWARPGTYSGIDICFAGR
jgi:hypothetical protein